MTHIRTTTGRSFFDLEQGASLIEVLIAVLLLGTVVVTVLTGMGASVRLSDYHGKRSATENVLVSAAERLKEVPKVVCATSSEPTYVAAAQAAATAQGWSGSAATITSVTYWNGTSYGTTCYDNFTNKLPLQQITVEVRHPRGDVVQVLTVVKGVG